MASRRAAWWGWGSRPVTLDSKPELHAYLRDKLGLEGDRRLAVPEAEDIALPPSRFSGADVRAFRDIVGPKGVGASHQERLSHAVGKGYRDLLRIRLAAVPTAPDLVLYPREEDDVARILRVCDRRGIGVVPFGGGTTVVGGVEVSDPSHAHVAVDLERLDTLIEIDAVSQTATAEAGILGPDLERGLGRSELTLGHDPQSFEFSTLGGWIASRSAGSLSNRYGKIEDLVVAMRLVAPSGMLDLRARPRHAMGPDLLSLAVGSEGTLGVITRATVRVHALPEARAYSSVLFPSFGEGLESLRAIAQGPMPPAMTYLFDEDETRLLAAGSGRAKGLATSLLRARGIRLGSAALLLAGYEGTKDAVWVQKEFARRRSRRGVSAGPSPAKQYVRERKDAPDLRDALIERCVMVDTLETAATW